MDWLRLILIASAGVVGLLYLWTAIKAAHFAWVYTERRRWNIGRVCAGLGVVLINTGTIQVAIARWGLNHHWGTWIVCLGEIVLMYGWILSGRVTIKAGHTVY